MIVKTVQQVYVIINCVIPMMCCAKPNGGSSLLEKETVTEM